MRTKACILLSLAIGAASVHAAKTEVGAPSQRTNIIRAASERLKAPVYTHPQSDVYQKNPFAPNKHLPAQEEIAPVPHGTDQEFLTKLAGQLGATGVLILGEQTFLLFGEKKVKVGESILIPFDNNSYEVELIGVTRTSFTVRLNQAEVTRSIKPAKQP